MIKLQEKQRQLQLLKWLTVALVLKLVVFNISPYVFYVQQLLIYAAVLKSLSYHTDKTVIKRYLFIGMGLLLIRAMSDYLLILYWCLVLGAILDLLIMLEFGKLLLAMETKYDRYGSTVRIMKTYQWVVLLVIASWTFLMNSSYDEQSIVFIVGTSLLFMVNVRVLFHLRSLKKHIRLTMRVVTYS